MANTSAVRLLLLFLCFTNIIALRKSSKFVSDGSDFVITGAEKYSESFIARTRRATVVNAYCIKYENTDDELIKYKKILAQERASNILFGDGWEKARRQGISSESLLEEEALSLTTYTLDEPNVYSEFNRQCRESGPNNANFQFEAMYYFLTMAVDKLSAKSINETAYKVYRGVTYNVSENVGEAFYFKNFASTSLNKKVAVEFLEGSDVKFLFTIQDTLQGAKISHYSVYPNEEEVIIPPCENFKVANKVYNNGIVEIYLVRSFGQKRCTSAGGLVIIIIGIVGLFNN